MNTRVWTAVTAATSIASLGLAAAVLGVVLDRPTVTSVDREQTAALRELESGNEHLTEHVHLLERLVVSGPTAESTTEAPAAETATGAAPRSTAASTAAAVAALPAPPAGKVTVKLAWTYRRMPGGEFQLFQPAPGLKLLDTTSYPAGVEVKTGAPIKDGTLFLGPGEHALVQVIWKNPSAKGKSFFVIPHIVTPSKLQSSTPWKCLCSGTIYVVPAHGTFSRVMDITMTKDAPAGAKLIGTHDVVASS